MIEYEGKELIIMACSKCNINCKHCYISYKGNRTPEKLLDMVKNLKLKYKINLNGAEVLTDIEYLKAYREILQEFIMTNGYAIYRDPTILDELEKNNINSVSISYHFGIHKEISTIPIEILNQVIKKLKDRKIDFRLMTTITSRNFDFIENICDHAYAIGAKGIKFTNYLLQGNAITLSGSEYLLSNDQKQKFFAQLIRCREKYDKHELIIERCGTFGKNSLSSHDHFCCDCITNSVVLTPDDNIYPCVFLAKPGYEIGKYNDGKIMIDKSFENNHDVCIAECECNEKKKIFRRNRI